MQQKHNLTHENAQKNIGRDNRKRLPLSEWAAREGTESGNTASGKYCEKTREDFQITCILYLKQIMRKGPPEHWQADWLVASCILKIHVKLSYTIQIFSRKYHKVIQIILWSLFSYFCIFYPFNVLCHFQTIKVSSWLSCFRITPFCSC